MESMNSTITEQSIHFQSKYDLMTQQNHNDLQLLRGEISSLNEKLQVSMQLNHKYQSDMGVFIADKTQLISQMSQAHVKDKAQMKQVLKLQDSNASMNQEIKAHTVRMQRNMSVKNLQDEIMHQNEILKQNLSETQLQLKNALCEMENMKSTMKGDSLQHQFKILSDENHLLKKQNLHVSNLNLELSQQVHEQTNQYELSQT